MPPHVSSIDKHPGHVSSRQTCETFFPLVISHSIRKLIFKFLSTSSVSILESTKMRRNILVTGATGKQGQALIRALLHPSSSSLAPASASDPPPEHTYHIYALTRNASSPAAQHLLSSANTNTRTHLLTLVEGDLDDAASIRQIFETAKHQNGENQGIWGVFAVLAFPGLGVEADGEERQGRLMVDLAVEFGVRCFVYSSAMRSGPRYEDQMRLSGKAKREVDDLETGLLHGEF